MMQSPEQLPANAPPSEQKQWNRWLTIIQAFTAPFFIVLIVWANTELEYPRALLRPTLYSMIFSLILLAILLTTTSPTRPPRWRTLLCFMGFAVSIAWISSIANEVVGVLKTLGVILNMSDAILGLTIFAVGNSLGDFVADITVARLGFPVMALSACFGGPMLNILLGIGISGCYITIKGGRHRHEKHPDRPLHFKPYPIDVSTTLVISGATLLVTLVSLLVVVPWRKWKMDKTIGWGLVALWSASTLANVVVEVVGLSSNVS
jgi:sodium/potassium/calcium exchanger 6